MLLCHSLMQPSQAENSEGERRYWARGAIQLGGEGVVATGQQSRNPQPGKDHWSMRSSDAVTGQTAQDHLALPGTHGGAEGGGAFSNPTIPHMCPRRLRCLIGSCYSPGAHESSLLNTWLVIKPSEVSINLGINTTSEPQHDSRRMSVPCRHWGSVSAYWAALVQMWEFCPAS